MARHLQVLLHGERLGELTQTDSGQLEFAYDAAWLDAGGPSLSLSLPCRPGPFGHRETEPYFGGLLPEADQRDKIARYLGISSRNDFALLEQIGGECAGAVSLLPLNPPTAVPPERTPQIVEPEQLVRLLEELPRRPLLVGGELRLSLAGAQDKIAVTLVKGDIALPTGSEPTTHILKTPIEHLDDTVANEYLCMRTAARLGLAVAEVERRVVLGREFLLIRRFDRELRAGRTVRIHQEDLCQALGTPTRIKYQAEGGPGLRECFELLTRSARRPARDRLALLHATVFNVLIGNADAHAKNFSLLHAEGGLSLAPLYDLLSTTAYADLSDRYAMKIGSKARFDEIRPRHWDGFADAAGLAKPQARRVVREVCKGLPGVLAREVEALPAELQSCPVTERIVTQTAQRCDVTLRRLDG